MSRMEWIKIYFNAENYLYRLFGIIIVLILVGIGLRNWLEYRTLEQEILDTAYREAKLMQEYFVSARYVYHQQFIQSGIELNHETIGFFPAHAASRISDEFQTRTSQAITVRNVSDHARNPKNAPMPYERIAIESFKRDANQSELFTQIRHGGREYFFYAMPLRIEPYCMMCHGKREDAPAYIRDTYTNGYNYHVGDVRGITSITIEKNKLLQNMQAKYKTRVIFSALIAGMIIVLIYLMIRRAHKIEASLIRELKLLSFNDPLTGLCNRRKLMEWIEEYHHLFERYGEPYSLIMADIDHFKAINDTYGHPIGDSVLQEFSSILKQSVREVDHTGRWGGEEFVIVLPKTIQSDGERIAISLQKKIEANNFTKVGQVTASFGVTQTQKGDTIESLFKRLDEALYRAKQSGRNQVVSLENDDASA